MRQLLLITLILLGFAAPAAAQDTAENLVQIRLVPEKTHVSSGEEILIGIEQSIKPHWHTYWRNPGDSGTAPRVKWILPNGFEVGDIQWPTPKKLPYGPLVNYGYEGTAALLQNLKVPKDIPEGPITLSADVEVLVCQEECIPEYGTYSLTLNDPAMEPANNAPYFEPAQRKVPGAMDDWQATFSEENGQLVLQIKPDIPEFFDGLKPETLEFFPIDWGVVDNTAKPEITFENELIVLKQARGDRPLENLSTIAGVLSYRSPAGGPQAFEITLNKGAVLPDMMPFSDDEKTSSLASALVFALIGGLILNLMPCVFPVLSLKALSLVKIADKHPLEAKLSGLAYTAGVMLSFIAIAAALIAFKAAGAQIGWGFHLQNPWIVGGLALLLLIISINFAGVFELKNPFANTGGKLAASGGITGSFFTGVLATLVATPCTAPFMAGAIAYALLQSEAVALTIFAALGFGLALPYLALSFIPALQKILPKPGRWMETFRKILAVPMFLAALWLGWVLAQQLAPAVNTPGMDGVYSAAALEQALESDQPVFVEMTAAWCITCKVNHKIAIDVPSTKKLFEEMNVNYLVGDWTNQDAEITKYLKSYGRSGVPLYVYYGPKDPTSGARPEPKVLPQVLTPGIVEDHIKTIH